MATTDLDVLPEGYERRYTYGGRVAHILRPLGLMQPYEAAQCGYEPQWGTAWLGSGTQNEEDTAHRLPLCRPCAESVRRHIYLKALNRNRKFADWSTVPHEPHEGRCVRDGHRWPCRTKMKEMRAAAGQDV
jgi:hypothetical protein